MVLRYPVVSFFMLAFGISWLAWTPYVLSDDGLEVLNFRYPDFLIGNQLTAILPGAYLGPLTAAFTVTASTEGREGLRRWRKRLFQFRAGIWWYALALVGIPAAILLGTLAMDGAEGAAHIPPLVVFAAYVPMLILQFFTTGLAEEPGWRDFALTRMQKRFHPLAATTILGVLWAAWHLPLFLTPWAGPDVGPESIGRFFLTAMALSFVMTLVFNKARQSVPLIMLLHGNFNNFMSVAWSEVFPGENPDWQWGPALGVGALAIVTIAATRGGLGART
jgi:membrane protease YdiL (CAAX protease family)